MRPIRPVLIALALIVTCAKDKTTALNIKLDVMGAIDQVRIDVVTIAANSVSLTGEQTLFPATARTLNDGDVLTIWFDDSRDGQTAAVTATGLLCGKDATAPTMTVSRMLAKAQTVETTLSLANNGTICTGDGGAGRGGGGGGGTGGVGGAAGSIGGVAGTGGSTGAAGTGGVAGTAGGAGRGGTGGAAGTGGTAGTAGRGGTGGAAGRGGTAGTGTGGAAGGGGTGGIAGGGAAGRGGTTGTGGAAGRGGTGGIAGGPAGTGGGGGVAGCNAGFTACTDCLDNDGDGLIDAQDDDCTGTIDNDEGSFSNAIPGDNVDPCGKDCYFDGNAGSGDDDCRWRLQCDQTAPGAPTCPYDPAQIGTASCPTSQSQTCLTKCGPLMPNGCDCFGCCEIPGGTGNAVLIAKAGCSMQGLTDPLKCPPCSIRSDCFNACDTCELCIGKHTVAPSCSGVQSCPAGHARCGLVGQPACPAGSFCLTGCCT